MSSRFIVWNEPLCLKPGFVANSICRATEEDIIIAMKGNFPERKYTDQKALDDFMVVHWAWFETQSEIEEAKQLLQEAVDRYPAEEDPKLWTSRVRKWLENE